jgi:two-component system response regulator LytT
MNVLIVEDEAPASRRLQQLIKETDSSLHIMSTVDSIDLAVKWLNSNPAPDIIFMDIQLADGLSFEIFNRANITSPVIFTTAYDEYALKAFKVNSIDYLLKPIEKEDLFRSIEKLKSLKKQFISKGSIPIQSLLETLKLNKNYKSRFLVKIGEKLVSISIDSIAYFISEDKLTFLVTNDNKKYPLDYSLDELDTMLDPKFFFRLNRQCLTKINSIQSIHNYFNGKLKLFLTPPTAKEMIVSREKSSHFKQWLEV